MTDDPVLSDIIPRTGIDAAKAIGLKLPKLLRIPKNLRSVEEVLACASKLDLPNVFVVSELADGRVVFMTTADMTSAHCNWVFDRAKRILLDPGAFEMTDR